MTTLEPIVKTMTIRCPRPLAFRVFTEGIARWWPLPSHSVGRAEAATVAFELREGGRLYETTRDGVEHVWGHVAVWEPPRCVAFSWHPGRGEHTAQRVEVSFAEASGGTEVQLVHSGWEHLGDGAAEARSQYTGGWDGVLSGFTEAAAAPPAFQVVFHRPGPEWRDGTPYPKQPGVELHVEHMRSLDARGVVVLGGPFTDDSGGMVVLSLPTVEIARELAEADPAVKAGLLQVEVRTWKTPSGTATR